jgi:hypothetical protein
MTAQENNEHKAKNFSSISSFGIEFDHFRMRTWSVIWSNNNANTDEYANSDNYTYPDKNANTD